LHNNYGILGEGFIILDLIRMDNGKGMMIVLTD